MTTPNVQQAALQRISRIMDNQREHEVCCAFDEYDDTPCNCSVAEDDAAFATIREACEREDLRKWLQSELRIMETQRDQSADYNHKNYINGGITAFNKVLRKLGVEA